MMHTLIRCYIARFASLKNPRYQFFNDSLPNNIKPKYGRTATCSCFGITRLSQKHRDPRPWRGHQFECVGLALYEVTGNQIKTPGRAVVTFAPINIWESNLLTDTMRTNGPGAILFFGTRGYGLIWYLGNSARNWAQNHRRYIYRNHDALSR